MASSSSQASFLRKGLEMLSLPQAAVEGANLLRQGAKAALSSLDAYAAGTVSGDCQGLCWPSCLVVVFEVILEQLGSPVN